MLDKIKNKVILADRQDITRAGLQFILNHILPGMETHYSEDKESVTYRLRQGISEPSGNAIVVLDYTQFDFVSETEMITLASRYPESHWILFSDDLSVDFIKRVIGSGSQFSVVLKDAPLSEIREAIKYAVSNRRYICQHVTELLFATPKEKEKEVTSLTATETEILKDIALGLTTKEIAEKRFSSFHTVNTHRKNIFRKLSVNNAHEATKYALRVGIVNEIEYYI